MTQVVYSMESALKSMNLEQISTMLQRFEKSFDNRDNAGWIEIILKSYMAHIIHIIKIVLFNRYHAVL